MSYYGDGSFIEVLEIERNRLTNEILQGKRVSRRKIQQVALINRYLNHASHANQDLKQWLRSSIQEVCHWVKKGLF